MSPEEVVPIFYPQIYNIGDPNLSDAEFPPVSLFKSSTRVKRFADEDFFCLARDALARDAHIRLNLLDLQRPRSIHPCRPVSESTADSGVVQS
jgi:hypothetical protein